MERKKPVAYLHSLYDQKVHGLTIVRTTYLVRQAGLLVRVFQLEGGGPPRLLCGEGNGLSEGLVFTRGLTPGRLVGPPISLLAPVTTGPPNCEFLNTIEARSAAVPVYVPCSPNMLRLPHPGERAVGPPISLPPMTLPAYIDCELGNIIAGFCHGPTPRPMPMFMPPKPGPGYMPGPIPPKPPNTQMMS